MTATQITITVKNGSTVDWIDLDLPTPTDVHHIERYSASYWNDKDDCTPYSLTYTIDGYFGTRDSKEYLHDMAARIACTLNGTYEISQTVATATAYKLSRFTHLDRPSSFNRQLEINAFSGSRSEIWNALRYKAYAMYRTNTLNLEALTNYGNMITNAKGKEHVKYLANNIFKWVETNYEGRQSLMTRSEAGLNASATKAMNMRNKVISALKSDLFSFSSLSNGAMKLSISRITFKKYVKQLEAIRVASLLYKSSLTPYVQLVYTAIEDIQKEVIKVVLWLIGDDLISVGMTAKGTAPPNKREYTHTIKRVS